MMKKHAAEEISTKKFEQNSFEKIETSRKNFKQIQTKFENFFMIKMNQLPFK